MSARHLAFARALSPRSRRSVSAVSPNKATTSGSASRPPRTTYVICTTPRSGSWLLSDGLAATALAGNPREWFNTVEEQEHRARWRLSHSSDLTYRAYLDHVLFKSATPNGVCGIKLHYYQFAELHKKLALVPGLDALVGAQQMSRAFPNCRYLWLTRRDKARQAISLHLAASTGSWWSIEGVDRAHSQASHQEPIFDAVAIDRFERALIDNDRKWTQYFEASGVEPLVIHYEDLVCDYRGHIVEVLKWLAVPNAENVSVRPTRLKRQSDARNDEWLSRYLSFKDESASPERNPSSSAVDDVFAEKAREFIPSAWREWIVQQNFMATPDAEVVEVLTNNGYPRDVAACEVAKASTDPYVHAAAQRHRHDSKAASLLNVIGKLNRLDSRARAIERRSELSPVEFRDRYYAANRPVIIRGLMSNWRAPTAWTPDYLKRNVGDQMVEIMTGRDADPQFERNVARHRTPIRFSDYVDMVYTGAATNDYNLVANNGFFQRFATHSLLRDIAPSLPYLRPVPAGRDCFLWFGPGGSLTPLHHDTCNILVAHVVGRKRYRLIPASQWQYVYNTSGVFSDVDCEAPDLTRHPDFRHATVIDVVVEPGEVLFVPVGWWHHVRALDVSIAVSFINFLYPNRFTWEPRP